MKRSQVAAARVQVAIAKRRGTTVEPWIQELADTPMANAGPPATSVDGTEGAKAKHRARRVTDKLPVVPGWLRNKGDHRRPDAPKYLYQTKSGSWAVTDTPARTPDAAVEPIQNVVDGPVFLLRDQFHWIREGGVLDEVAHGKSDLEEAIDAQSNSRNDARARTDS